VLFRAIKGLSSTLRPGLQTAPLPVNCAEPGGRFEILSRKPAAGLPIVGGEQMKATFRLSPLMVVALISLSLPAAASPSPRSPGT
jgi:hypothetical protein